MWLWKLSLNDVLIGLSIEQSGALTLKMIIKPIDEPKDPYVELWSLKFFGRKNAMIEKVIFWMMVTFI